LGWRIWNRGQTIIHEQALGRLGPNLEPGAVVVYVTHGSQNGLDIEKRSGLVLEPETVVFR